MSEQDFLWLLSLIMFYLVIYLFHTEIVESAIYRYIMRRTTIRENVNGLIIIRINRQEHDLMEDNLNIDDNHNVHNVTIRRDIKKYLSIQKNIPNVIGDLVNYLKKQKEAYKIFKKIVNINAYYENVEMHELQIINLVWSKIKDNKDLKEFFLVQLLDCKTGGGFHCCEGRIARYMQSLELMDELSMRPLWLYKDEIAGIFSDYYEKGVNDKELIEKDLEKRYIQSKKLSEEELKYITKDFMSYILSGD